MLCIGLLISLLSGAIAAGLLKAWREDRFGRKPGKTAEDL